MLEFTAKNSYMTYKKIENVEDNGGRTSLLRGAVLFRQATLKLDIVSYPLSRVLLPST